MNQGAFVRVESREGGNGRNDQEVVASYCDYVRRNTLNTYRRGEGRWAVGKVLLCPPWSRRTGCSWPCQWPPGEPRGEADLTPALRPTDPLCQPKRDLPRTPELWSLSVADGFASLSSSTADEEWSTLLLEAGGPEPCTVAYSVW